MSENEIDKKKIESLLPHREPMLLIDELYDRRVKVLMSAASPIAELYSGQQFAFEFERTESRIVEMQSQKYLTKARLSHHY